MLQGLYVISDDTLTPQESMLEQIELTLKAGVKIVQYRDKKSAYPLLKENAYKLQQLCRKYDALFVLNDAFEIAIEEGFDGLHVGKSDYENIEEIRKNFKGILGVSCYGNLEQAKKMQDIGVDYVAFGSFFTSPTKPNSAVVDFEVLGKAKEKLSIPICAIGGINSQNVEQIIKYKPDMVAVISDIWLAEDITEKSKFYMKLYEE